jgi:hypothetical protein
MTQSVTNSGFFRIIKYKTKTMTKKEFKEMVSDHTYTGWNGKRIRVNAFFFDFKQGTTEDGKYFGGYKFRVSTDVRNCSKAELLNEFYNWVTGKTQQVPWYVDYRYAETDVQRFKPGLSL